jgi:hypothetical protein
MPPPVKKRGILNIAGMLLKSLFGTATMMDLSELEEKRESMTQALD